MSSMSYVYCIRNKRTNRVKLGKGNNPYRRLKTLQTGNDDPLVLEATIETQYPFKVERALHSLFSAFRKSGEWFDLPEKEDRILRVIFGKEEATEYEIGAFRRLGIW